MSNIEKAKDALKLIEEGENPLDNYETVKGALKESEAAIGILWEGLSPKMIDSLKKDKEIAPIIKAYKKELEAKIKEVGKKMITFKYANAEEYDKWADKAKDTPLTRRTKFVHEVVWPIMNDLFDKFFFEMSEMAQSGKISNLTVACPECNNTMTYRKNKDKMVCGGCGKNEDPKNIGGKKEEPYDAVVYDMMDLPNANSIARQMSGILDQPIDDYLKAELKKKNG